MTDGRAPTGADDENDDDDEDGETLDQAREDDGDTSLGDILEDRPDEIGDPTASAEDSSGEAAETDEPGDIAETAETEAATEPAETAETEDRSETDETNDRSETDETNDRSETDETNDRAEPGPARDATAASTGSGQPRAEPAGSPEAVAAPADSDAGPEQDSTEQEGPRQAETEGSADDESDVPADVRKYDRFKKIEGGTYDRANDFLRERTYITAREWAIARLCADFRTETGVEMTKIGENLPELVPFMTDTYTPQAVNQARASFEDKVRQAGATFLYGAMCEFFTAEQLDDVMYEATEVAKFLLEVEGVELTVDEELEAEDRISEVMREVREQSAALRHDDICCPDCGAEFGVDPKTSLNE